jgi:hypothetical protein
MPASLFASLILIPPLRRSAMKLCTDDMAQLGGGIIEYASNRRNNCQHSCCWWGGGGGLKESPPSPKIFVICPILHLVYLSLKVLVGITLGIVLRTYKLWSGELFPLSLQLILGKSTWDVLSALSVEITDGFFACE